MIAAYYLVIFIVKGNGAGLTQIPMENKELCETARAQVQEYYDSSFTTPKALCVKAKQD